MKYASNKNICMLCLIIPLFFSCKSVQYIWDDALTNEETVTLVFSSSIIGVDSYNAVATKTWKRPGFILIPGGKTELGVSINMVIDGYNTRTIITGENMLFSFEYEPGKTYFLKFYQKDGKWGVGIYSSHWTRKNQLIDFIPFSNAKGNA
ncbi:MAG: hypothetical protein Ta2B_09810 [Termitinemataceae bacterium]|nr:MAG: hypothetical protein Ta2B_09810 [Termitinemataceae bacterium]